MPLVRISLVKSKPPEYRRQVGDAIHRALTDTLEVTAATNGIASAPPETLHA